MRDTNLFEDFTRARITELRLEANVSEHRMSLELGKSESYIRSITSGRSLPSLRKFFRICLYFGLSPDEFFAPLESGNTARAVLSEKLRKLDDYGLEKVFTFVDWID